MEKWRLKLTSAKVEVEVEAELGNDNPLNVSQMLKLFEYHDMHFDNHFEKVSPFCGLIKVITGKLEHL